MLGGNFGAPKAPLKPVFLEEILPISLLNDGFHKENHMGKVVKRQNFPPAAGQKVKTQSCRASNTLISERSTGYFEVSGEEEISDQILGFPAGGNFFGSEKKTIVSRIGSP